MTDENLSAQEKSLGSNVGDTQTSQYFQHPEEKWGVIKIVDLRFMIINKRNKN